MSQPPPPQARPPKAMSSRLMTMKFMQRAAASIPPSTPQLQSQPASTPPSKRQKLSNGNPSLNTTPSESELIQSALDEDAAKREEAIERLAEEAGETKWVLSTVNGDPEVGVKGLRVAIAGYFDIDQDALRPAMQGRKSFGKFNRELEKRRNGTADRDSSSSDESSTGGDENSQESQESQESDDPAGTSELIRVAKRKAERLERKQQRKAEQAEIARLAEKRRSKGVNLNRLSSISGANASAGKSSAKGNRECFQCGEKGHEKRECPHKEQRGDEDGRGGRSKISRSSLAC